MCIFFQKYIFILLTYKNIGGGGTMYTDDVCRACLIQRCRSTFWRPWLSILWRNVTKKLVSRTARRCYTCRCCTWRICPPLLSGIWQCPKSGNRRPCCSTCSRVPLRRSAYRLCCRYEDREKKKKQSSRYFHHSKSVHTPCLVWSIPPPPPPKKTKKPRHGNSVNKWPWLTVHGGRETVEIASVGRAGGRGDWGGRRGRSFIGLGRVLAFDSEHRRFVTNHRARLV